MRVDLSALKSKDSRTVLLRKDICVVQFGVHPRSTVRMPVKGAIWKPFKYLCFDVFSHNTDRASSLFIEFWEEGNLQEDKPDFRFMIGVIPRVKTRIDIPLEALCGEKVFLQRPPGTFRFTAHGKRVSIDRVSAFSLTLLQSSIEQRIQISDMFLSMDKSEVPPQDIRLIDELGQWTGKEWPGKSRTAAEMVSRLQNEWHSTSQKSDKVESFSDRSRYGGWKGLRFEATGYFRTQHDGRRWWLVDPEGYAFLSTGLNCVSPHSPMAVNPMKTWISWLPGKEGEFGEGWRPENPCWGEEFDFSVANLIRTFGVRWGNCWNDLTLRRLAQWGFNSIGNWSSRQFIQYSGMPYIIQLNDFPATAHMIFRDFPDVFSLEYEENSKKYAAQLEPIGEDRNLIGYFLCNEPIWSWCENPIIAEDLLENPQELESKNAFIRFLSERYSGDAEAFNKAWNTSLTCFDQLKHPMRRASKQSEQAYNDLVEFSKVLVRRYYEIPCKALRHVDSLHLNLGMRFAGISNRIMLEGAEIFDVFSINCYKIDPSEALESVSRYIDRPILIGEFHFGALDRGLIATGLRAVTSQQERGLAYLYYLHRIAADRHCVGAHYFKLNDQPFLGRFDGENYQIGLVDVCHSVYEEFTQGVIHAHQTLYEVAAGRLQRYDIYPDETDWVGY